jgi:hypothetical protein
LHFDSDTGCPPPRPARCLGHDEVNESGNPDGVLATNQQQQQSSTGQLYTGTIEEEDPNAEPDLDGNTTTLVPRTYLIYLLCLMTMV